MTAVLGDPTTNEPTTRCEQCGITDNHPKVVSAAFNTGESHIWHHDCTPVDVQNDIIAGALCDGHPQHKVIAAQTFQACRESKRGEDLRGFIKELHAAVVPDTGAQMILATAAANALEDILIPNGASGSVVLGALTYTLPGKIKWLSTVSTAGTAGTEWTGGSYPAGGVSLAGAATSGASAGAKASTSALSVTNSPALTWADNEIQDSAGTPIRIQAKGTPSLAISVSSGSTATIPSGSLTGAAT